MATVWFPLISLLRLNQQPFVMLDGLDGLFDKFGSAFRVVASELAFRTFRACFILLKKLLGRGNLLVGVAQQAVHVLRRCFGRTRDCLAKDRRVIRRRRDHQGSRSDRRTIVPYGSPLSRCSINSKQPQPFRAPTPMSGIRHCSAAMKKEAPPQRGPEQGRC